MALIIRTLHLICCLLASYVFSGAGDQVIRYGMTYLIEKYTSSSLKATPASKKRLMNREVKIVKPEAHFL